MKNSNTVLLLQWNGLDSIVFMIVKERKNVPHKMRRNDFYWKVPKVRILAFDMD